VITQVLLHFKCQIERLVLDLKFDRQRAVDVRQVFREFDIHDWANDLYNFASIHVALFR
jgi:hypothetical protein